MGNLASGANNVASHVKDQAESANPINKLVTLNTDKGAGILVECMKKAHKTKNYSRLHDQIRKSVQPFLYVSDSDKQPMGEHDGDGIKWKNTIYVPVKEFVEYRDKNRKKQQYVPPSRIGVNRVDVHKDIGNVTTNQRMGFLEMVMAIRCPLHHCNKNKKSWHSNKQFCISLKMIVHLVNS